MQRYVGPGVFKAFVEMTPASHAPEVKEWFTMLGESSKKNDAGLEEPITMSQDQVAALQAQLSEVKAEIRHLQGDLRDAKADQRRAIDDAKTASSLAVNEIKTAMKEAIAELNNSRQRHISEIYPRLAEIEKALNIERGQKAIKATLWTAMAGGAGAGVTWLLNAFDAAGKGPQQ